MLHSLTTEKVGLPQSVSRKYLPRVVLCRHDVKMVLLQLYVCFDWRISCSLITKWTNNKIFIYCSFYYRCRSNKSLKTAVEEYLCCHRDVITLHRVTHTKYEALETRFESPTQVLGVTLVSVTRCKLKRWLGKRLWGVSPTTVLGNMHTTCIHDEKHACHKRKCRNRGPNPTRAALDMKAKVVRP